MKILNVLDSKWHFDTNDTVLLNGYLNIWLGLINMVLFGFSLSEWGICKILKDAIFWHQNETQFLHQNSIEIPIVWNKEDKQTLNNQLNTC